VCFSFKILVKIWKSSNCSECISFYCQTIHHKEKFNQMTFQCRQQKAFINTLMTEIVFFTQYVLKHNKIRSLNNIFSLREKQSFKQPLVCCLVPWHFMMIPFKDADLIYLTIYNAYWKWKTIYLLWNVCLSTATVLGCSTHAQISKHLCITNVKIFINLF
jgi:hypothetical protein